MKITELVARCEDQLDSETFKAMIATFRDLTFAKNTAVARHNHYLIGFEAMIDHKCKGAAFRFMPGKPHGHFECVVCKCQV